MCHSRHALAPVTTILLTALAACSSPSEPGGPEGLHVVAGEGVTDTVEAKPLQALVVEVRDEDGRPLRDVIVLFAGEQLPRDPADPSSGYTFSAYVSRLEKASFLPFGIDTTDERGRASALVQLGTRAGGAAVRVSAPEVGYADTARFTVTAGAAARVVSLPADTALLAGRSFTLRASVADRFGNPRQDPVTYAGGAAGISVSGSTVTTQALARSWVVARAGDGVDTTYVSVVPGATLAANTGRALVTFGTDGSGLDTVATTPESSLTTDWSPDGREIVFDRASIGDLYVVDVASGAVRVASPLGAIYGRFSPDATSLYYSRIAWYLRRQNRDGTNDVPVPMQAPASDVYPAPSPDGTRLAYVTTTGGRDDVLKILTLATGASTSLGIAGHSPNWSPAGTRIAFVDALTGELKLVNPDGTGVRALSPTGRYQRGLDWSPDGRWLVAWNIATNVTDLIDTESGLVLPLEFTRGWTGPSWKP